MTNFNFFSRLESWMNGLSSRICPESLSYSGSGTIAGSTERRPRDNREMSERQSGARVAREWLKYAAAFAMLLTVGIGNVWGAIANGTYVLCTSTGDLVSGEHYIIASGTSGSVYCISNVSQSNYREQVSATVSDSKISVGSSSTIMTFTLGGSSDKWTFYTDNYKGTAGYLASAASGKNNYCLVISTSTTGTISFSDNAAVINLNPHSTRTLLSYNSSSSRFACYTAEQNPVYLYKKADDTKCATPTFSVTGGTYTTSKSVTLSCSTDGATIRYTTDGTDPTESSAAYSSAITVDASKTIKAKAFKAGLTASDVASATYTIKCATPTFSEAGGTKNNDVNVTLSTSFGTSIYYTTDGSTPTTSSTLYSGAITVNATQTIKAIAVKSGCSDSDEASATYTMDCATPTYSENAFTSTGPTSITLNTKTEGATIYYTTDGSTPTSSSIEYTGAIQINVTTTIKVIAIKDGYNNSSVPTQKTYTIKCAQPVASPAAGTYSGPQDIELSTTYGDKIYYTMTEDGTTPEPPSESSTEYDGPIHMTVVTKIKAIAWKDGCSNSNQLGGSYGDTYTIQYNVTWMVDGVEWSDKGGSTTVDGGGHISTLPTAPTTGEFCGDRFMGWTDAPNGEYVHGSSGLYTTASSFPNATGDQVFYAVFADYAE